MKKFVLLAAGIAIGFAACNKGMTPTAPAVLMVPTLAGGASSGNTDGGAAAQPDHPRRLAVDVAGGVYVADGNGGVARFENLSRPSIDAAGNIYVADIGRGR